MGRAKGFRLTRFDVTREHRLVNVFDQIEVLCLSGVRFEMIVPVDCAYVEIFELPKEKLVTYDQRDGHWLSYFGKAKVARREPIGIASTIEMFPFIGYWATGFIAEAIALQRRNEAHVRGYIIDPSEEILLASEDKRTGSVKC